MSEKTPDQLKLEAAVAKIAKAYNDLAKAVEKGSTIEAEHIAKVFGFLEKVNADGYSKALLSISTAKAVNGGFSLDQEVDLTPSPIAHQRVRRERMVGEQKGPKPPPDDDDDVGFVDD